MSPLLAATLGALITTWTTFVPGFLWVLLGAPHVERLRGNHRFTAALSAVTAAVVGVMSHLAVWFALQTVFPAPHRVDWFVIVVAGAALVGMVRWRWGIIPIIVGAAVLGVVRRLLAGG